MKEADTTTFFQRQIFFYENGFSLFSPPTYTITSYRKSYLQSARANIQIHSAIICCPHDITTRLARRIFLLTLMLKIYFVLTIVGYSTLAASLSQILLSTTILTVSLPMFSPSFPIVVANIFAFVNSDHDYYGDGVDLRDATGKIKYIK